MRSILSSFPYFQRRVPFTFCIDKIKITTVNQKSFLPFRRAASLSYVDTKVYESYVGRDVGEFTTCPIGPMYARLRRVTVRTCAFKQRKILAMQNYIIDVTFVATRSRNQIVELGRADSHAFAFVREIANWQSRAEPRLSFQMFTPGYTSGNICNASKRT